MIICPYCLQDDIWKIKIKGTDELLKACLECDTVWKIDEEISYGTGTGIEKLMRDRKWSSTKDKFEIIDKF